MSKKQCKHFVCSAGPGGKVAIVLFERLDLYCRSMAKMYYVGLGDPPAENAAAIRKQFYPYCPKCGKQILGRTHHNVEQFYD